MQCPVCIKLTYIMYIFTYLQRFTLNVTSAKCATQVYRGKVGFDKICDKKSCNAGKIQQRHHTGTA